MRRLKLIKGINMTLLKAKNKRIMDIDTGEVTEITELLVTKTDINFDKVWTSQLAAVLDLAGSKPIKILAWFIEERDHRNMAVGTYPKIAEVIGCSESSVKLTIKILLDAGVISKIQNGVYRVNPNLVWQGDSNRRQAILLEYRREGGADIKPLRRQAPKEVTEAELIARLKVLDLEMESLKAQLLERSDSQTG
jgi:predicted transcriptional regulator